MRRTTFKLLFYLKRSKRLANGEAPIYLRITVNGKRAEFGIKRSVLPDSWKENKTMEPYTPSKEGYCNY